MFSDDQRGCSRGSHGQRQVFILTLHRATTCSDWWVNTTGKRFPSVVSANLGARNVIPPLSSLAQTVVMWVMYRDIPCSWCATDTMFKLNPAPALQTRSSGGSPRVTLRSSSVDHTQRCGHPTEMLSILLAPVKIRNIRVHPPVSVHLGRLLLRN